MGMHDGKASLGPRHKVAQIWHSVAASHDAHAFTIFPYLADAVIDDPPRGAP